MSEEDLPISGPLGKGENYQPTNKDLYENALRQNKAINIVHGTVRDLGTNVQTLATTVASHAKVISLLESIKTTAIWILSFLGVGGVLTFLNWVKLWWQH